MLITLGDEDISDTVYSGDIEWDTSGEYDGWERAGTEAWMRKGYVEGEPTVIQKSGNGYTTLKRGTLLDELGAHIVPTIMDVDEDSLQDDSQQISYEMYQKFVSGPQDDVVNYDRELIEFRERYNRKNDLSDQAIEQFAENCAILDTAGYKPISGNAVIRDFLTEGEECYLVDFGQDLGSTAKPLARNNYSMDNLSADELMLIQQNELRNDAYQLLDEADTVLFDETYEETRRDLIATYADEADVDRIIGAQDMSAYERRYLQKQVG